MAIPRDLLVPRRDGTNQPLHNADGRPGGGSEIPISLSLPPRTPLPPADETLSNASGSLLDPRFVDPGPTRDGREIAFPDRLPRTVSPFEEEPLSTLSGTFLDPSPGPGVCCPRCGSGDTRPSLRKTRSASFLKSLWSKPYRCRACDHKFLGPRWKA